MRVISIDINLQKFILQFNSNKILYNNFLPRDNKSYLMLMWRIYSAFGDSLSKFGRKLTDSPESKLGLQKYDIFRQYYWSKKF